MPKLGSFINLEFYLRIKILTKHPDFTSVKYDFHITEQTACHMRGVPDEQARSGTALERTIPRQGLLKLGSSFGTGIGMQAGWDVLHPSSPHRRSVTLPYTHTHKAKANLLLTHDIPLLTHNILVSY